MKFKELKNSPLAQLKAEGWEWILGENTLPYVENTLIEVSESEAENYYEAANELYEMYTEAAQYVIDHDLYEDLGIPSSLVPSIRYSWENDRGWHLYGRFDLSGGLDGKPIKLIEFNADTATCIPETELVQWAALKANGLDEESQFNTLFETFVNTFKELKETNADKEPAILFTSMEGFPEDYSNVEVLMQAAKEAGFEVAHEYIENVDFSPSEGIFIQNADSTFTRFDFWFKLIPWEFMAWDEPELLKILTELVISGKTVVMNPAYTMLFQSKGILKILWDLYPNHPLLLETSDVPLKNKAQVEKVMLGREGANVKIIREGGSVENFTTGEYDRQRSVYQEYVEFLKDDRGNHFQAGVFVSGEACGLGFRKGGQIIDNKAQFCGHVVI